MGEKGEREGVRREKGRKRKLLRVVGAWDMHGHMEIRKENVETEKA